MKFVKTAFVWGGGLFIAAIFIDSLRFKFASHQTPEHIFTTLREWSGIGLFYPAGPWIIGSAELLSAILLIAAPLLLLLIGAKTLIRKSQFFGAFIAFGVMSGAIIFHLFTPLGIETPVEWDGNVPTKYSPALFYSATVSWIFAVIIMVANRRSVLG
jgi:hypothetical protein